MRLKRARDETTLKWPKTEKGGQLHARVCVSDQPMVPYPCLQILCEKKRKKDIIDSDSTPLDDHKL